MPRKQRFKPSRKPQAQVSVSSQQVDDRKEINPEQSASQSSSISEPPPSRDLEHK